MRRLPPSSSVGPTLWSPVVLLAGRWGLGPPWHKTVQSGTAVQPWQQRGALSCISSSQTVVPTTLLATLGPLSTSRQPMTRLERWYVHSHTLSPQLDGWSLAETHFYTNRSSFHWWATPNAMVYVKMLLLRSGVKCTLGECSMKDLTFPTSCNYI